VNFIDAAVFAAIMAVVIAITLFTLDDFFVDAVALLRRLGPRRLKPEELTLMRLMPKKRIAILVANWHEEDVLEYMIRGNVQNIEYENYSFFLGVYPNDPATWEAARKLEKRIPNVSVIVNSQPGPTSKGQLLNEMVRRILESEKITGNRHDLFLLQDSEDLIHPLSLQLLNPEAEAADFVQVPVFSLPTKGLKLVAGVYMDEFAESHTKEMLVRASLGAPIPSAGVGTAMSRQLVQALIRVQDGCFLNEDCLTEDYQLGLLTARLGFRSTFACTYRMLAGGEKDFVATREYFPEHMKASVRQKTRWTIGIAFQSTKRFGWAGGLMHRYFLWRDRRGPLNGLLFAGAASLGLGLLTYFFASGGELPAFTANPYFQALTALNLGQMIWRIGQRMACTYRVYGAGKALLVPLRWPVGNVVNTWAAWRAFRVYRESVRKGERPAWVKTQHKLPEQFGRIPLALESNLEELRA
jgi:bacteriophage N4 adsorption protein B